MAADLATVLGQAFLVAEEHHVFERHEALGIDDAMPEGGHAHAHEKLFLADGALPGFDFLGHARLHGMNIHELLPPLVLSP